MSLAFNSTSWLALGKFLDFDTVGSFSYLEKFLRVNSVVSFSNLEKFLTVDFCSILSLEKFLDSSFDRLDDALSPEIMYQLFWNFT